MNPPYCHVDCPAEEPDPSGGAVACPIANLLANDMAIMTSSCEFDLAILPRFASLLRHSFSAILMSLLLTVRAVTRSEVILRTFYNFLSPR
jgi:hypothetical protein